ncbi:MAG: aspartate aminotransferase family protein [Rhodospirillales bacterium]
MALSAVKTSTRTPTISELQKAQISLSAKTPRSREMAKDRTEVINGAMAASGVCPPPIFIGRNDGAYFEDIDGNHYIDTCMGFGVHVLGHRPPAVEQALRDQIKRGWHFSLRGEDQLAYARLIQAAAKSNERVVFCNTGTEATMYAIRAARAMTGKSKVALFDISYHGAHDSVLIWETPGSAPGDPQPTTLGHGIPSGVLDDVMLLPYRHPAALKRIRDNADDLAAVLVEPVQGSRPDGDVADFLRELRELCDELGLILIFDEVLTGFRLSYGGAQERFRVQADITTYGKAVAGGLPIGIVAGRKDLMESFGDFMSPKGIFFGGTFSGNPLSIAAGLGALRHLRSHPEVYDHIDRLTARLTAAFNGYCEKNGYTARIVSCGSMWQIFFGEEAITDFGDTSVTAESAFYMHCLNAGIFIHATHRCYFSAAHTDKHVDAIFSTFVNALEMVRADGLA